MRVLQHLGWEWPCWSLAQLEGLRHHCKPCWSIGVGIAFNRLSNYDMTNCATLTINCSLPPPAVRFFFFFGLMDSSFEHMPQMQQLWNSHLSHG